MAIIQAIQEIEVLHKHRCMKWMAQTENERDRFYKRPNPGYGATFLTTLEQRVEMAISLFRHPVSIWPYCWLTRWFQLLYHELQCNGNVMVLPHTYSVMTLRVCS